MSTDNQINTHPNPLLTAGWLSQFFFWWLKDIVKYTQTHDLVAKDLYDTTSEDLSEPLRCHLESAWVEELHYAREENKKPSLWKVIAKTYFWNITKFSSNLLIFMIIQMWQPQILKAIMSYFRPDSTSALHEAYFIATVWVLAHILSAAILFHGLFHLRRLGMRARLACSSLIYKKMMRLPSSANKKINSSIISLFSIDVTKFDLIFSYIPFLIFVPVQLLVVTFLVSQSVGLVAAAAGITLMILLTIPLQVLHSTMTLKFRKKQAVRTDNRVTLIGEIVNGIRAVKLYVWEKCFEKIVYAARRLEIASYLHISYLTSVVRSIISAARHLCVYAIILAYELRYGGVIAADEILPVAQYMINLELCFAYYFFFGVKSITDMCISMKRIEDFLLLEEVESKTASIDGSASQIISFKNVTVSLDDKLILFNNICLNFFSNKLYVISGPMGSGKSSILKLILGELKSASGEVMVRGTMSYASQEPWLFNGTVRDNILLGEDYDEARYEQVVSACALAEDFTQLLHGDNTLVGDRGNNLSGGQRARINLARAVYRESDIYLLDDPLSAVDTHVAKHIMKECINGLIVGKIRILATHNVQNLLEDAEILIVDNGRIERRQDMEDFQRYEQHTEPLAEVLKESITSSAIDKPVIRNDQNSHNGKDSNETTELIAKGHMKTSVYLTYIKSGGFGLAVLIMLTSFVYIMAASAFNFGLGAWTRKGGNYAKDASQNNSTILEDDGSVQIHYTPVEKSLFTFGSLTALMTLSLILQVLFLSKFSLNASKNIHNLIFSRLLMAPIRFFEGNSTGQVLNRFSEDTGTIDNALPYSLCDAMYGILGIIAFLISVVTANWWILIPSMVSSFFSLLNGKFCILALQKIKRCAGIAKSPILSFAASSLEGVTTIRSCRAEHFVIKDFDTRQDRHTASQFLAVALSEAFTLWTQLINVGLLGLTTYLCVFLKNESTDEGYVGLSLLHIFQMLVMIAGVVKRVAEICSHMTNVERMLQFTELEQESIIENEPAAELPNSWPSKGQIVFDNLYLRYFEDKDPVLWDVNCVVEAGSKVGIVGRTGAGKSSLTSALFRFAKTDGTIFIDGIDIKRVDLHKLRSKLSIIPQEPVLFRGSLRKNLDPLDKFDDATLWSALESVELRRVFNSLDFPIDRAGGNLSIGQRQLLCLARAVINKNKILILDEATANVDSATDALIQKMIRSIFKECTVLTIAHRLETVMDNDKVLVMDNGRLVEYDHPFSLLQNKGSYLYKMAEQMGPTVMQNLIDLAEQAYKSSSVLKQDVRIYSKQ